MKESTSRLQTYVVGRPSSRSRAADYYKSAIEITGPFPDAPEGLLFLGNHGIGCPRFFVAGERRFLELAPPNPRLSAPPPPFTIAPDDHLVAGSHTLSRPIEAYLPHCYQHSGILLLELVIPPDDQGHESALDAISYVVLPQNSNGSALRHYKISTMLEHPRSLTSMDQKRVGNCLLVEARELNGVWSFSTELTDRHKPSLPKAAAPEVAEESETFSL